MYGYIYLHVFNVSIDSLAAACELPQAALGMNHRNWRCVCHRRAAVLLGSQTHGEIAQTGVAMAGYRLREKDRLGR